MTGTGKQEASTHNKAIINWLYLCCFAVLAMAVIGAITRLTESGLSLVEWRPVTGWLPPLNEAEWLRQYELYKQSPEFIHKHHWMGLADFKQIFFWEWFHRLWGRLIGLIYALPLLWFWVRKQIPSGYGLRFVGLLALGALQGVIGWWMVKSGLVDNPYVSPYRLAIHLGLALVIFSLLYWTVLDLKPAEPKRPSVLPSLLGHGVAAVFCLSLAIVWGAFVAGFDAGLIYNTFPLMNGSFTPPEIFTLTSPVADHAWIQFTHRWLGVSAGLVLFAFGWRLRDKALMAMVLVQIALGISTLLTQVFIPLAALHQAGAITLLALGLQALHRIIKTYAPAAGPRGTEVPA